MAFSRTGGRLFVATGEVVEFPNRERQAGPEADQLRAHARRG